MIAVIIPIYNRYELTHARLQDLYRFVSDQIEIIVVDDASPKVIEIQAGLRWWQGGVSRHPIHYHRNDVNLGFGGSCNVGAEIAIERGADILVFLSNDVIINGNFIDAIKHTIVERNDVLIGGQIVDWKAGWNEVPFNGHTMIIPYAAGWLIVCTSEIWKRLGGFDPLFGRFDYEDVDLSTTALSLGIDLVGLNLPYLRHLSGATIATLGIDRMAKTLENKQKYLQKWEDRWPEIYARLEKAHAK